jgi:hypothetical protein
MGADHLYTFISRRVQPLRWREVTMWRYSGPSCPDRSFSAELADAEVDTRVRRILALGVNRHSVSDPVPLRDGVVSPWVRSLGLISA